MIESTLKAPPGPPHPPTRAMWGAHGTGPGRPAWPTEHLDNCAYIYAITHAADLPYPVEQVGVTEVEARRHLFANAERLLEQSKVSR